MILSKAYIEEPLLLVNNNNKIQSFSNVCTHRGNILVEKAGNIKNGIICRYHGRNLIHVVNLTLCLNVKTLENFPSKMTT